MSQALYCMPMYSGECQVQNPLLKKIPFQLRGGENGNRKKQRKINLFQIMINCSEWGMGDALRESDIET